MEHKERPILFSGAMVRAIMDGTKKQTRRVVKSARDPNIGCWMTPGEIALDAATVQEVMSPYGQPGDRLWVREAWAEVPRVEPRTDEDLPWRMDGRIIVYRADPQWNGARQFLCADGVLRWAKPERWRPSIHMPRVASRIELDITGVRLERLQAISEADALAEGIVTTRGGFGLPDGSHYHATDPRQAYFSLWEAINGPGSVEANPWVWAVEFERK